MPSTAVYVFLLAVAAVALVVIFRPMVKAWLRARGDRLVACPETNEPVAVAVDPVDAAFSALLGTREVHLKSCTRWPEKAGCGQECLAQIEKAPNGCLVSSILREWYAGKICTLCGKPFGEMHTWEHKPALMSPERVTSEWVDVPVEELPERLATHLPICWDCHIIETLYRMHPDLVTERESHKPYWV
jgi:hypothetical protein